MRDGPCGRLWILVPGALDAALFQQDVDKRLVVQPVPVQGPAVIAMGDGDSRAPVVRKVQHRFDPIVLVSRGCRATELPQEAIVQPVDLVQETAVAGAGKEVGEGCGRRVMQHKCRVDLDLES